MKAIFTSTLGGSIKIDGKRIPERLIEKNGLLERLSVCWKDGAKVLIISGAPDEPVINESVLYCMKGAFELSGLKASCVYMCDAGNKELAERIPEMDVVILAGGHVPTQNAFLKEIGLKEKLKDWDGLLLAWSAGAMNCAETVYAGPELPGEAIDPNYKRWIDGLGITKTNIFPHFEALRDEMLDGMRLIEDITYADSFGHEIIALNNGSYIICENGAETVYGEAYLIKDGELLQICSDGESRALSNM